MVWDRCGLTKSSSILSSRVTPCTIWNLKYCIPNATAVNSASSPGAGDAGAAKAITGGGSCNSDCGDGSSGGREWCGRKMDQVWCGEPEMVARMAQ